MADTGTTAVINYKANIEDIKRQVKVIQRANTILGKQLGKDFSKGATVVKSELVKITTLAKGIKLPLGGVTNQVKQYATVLKTANGQLVTVRHSTAGVGKNMKVFNQSVSKGAKVTRTMGQNLATLAKRAALTIPLWFALRQGIGSVFRTIKDGLTAIVDFDRALQKAKRNLQGSAQSIERNFGILRKEVTKLSIETGRSVEDITHAFQKFATVGFDFETSMAGANAATKLSILLFGDVKETAFAFARSMRVLIDTTEGAAPASQQLAEIMALTNELWKTNAFELSELTQSLEKFAPAAKTAGFSAQETVKILAGLSTAGLRAGRAGRLLRTSMTRLLTSTDKLAKSLGVKVNPEVDRTYDVFLRTLDALAKTRNEAGRVSPAFEKIVKSIFGLRSADAIKGLIALRKNLQKVLGVTGDVSKFNKEFKELNKTIPQLVDQFRNLNKEIGKAFVTGIVGGEDFRDSLEDIVELQKVSIANAKLLGLAFNNTFKFLDFLVNIATLGAPKIAMEFIKSKDEIEKTFEELSEKTQESFKVLVRGIRGELDRIELEKLISEVKAKIKISKTDVSVDTDKVLPQVLVELEKHFEDLDPIEPTIKVKINKIEITTEQQSELIKSIIDDQLKRLKLEGATELQILKLKDALLKEYDVNDGIVKQKQRQLDIERSISEEQRLRNQLSSETVKLYKIAKEEGTGIARKIGEVLSGQRDFNSFLRVGGKEVEVFKKQFADVFEQQQALRFIKGERIIGEPELRGGERIPIREEELRRPTTPSRAKASVELSQLRLGITKENITALQQNTVSLDSLVQAMKEGATFSGESQRRVSKYLIESAKAEQVLRTIANLPVGRVTTAGVALQKRTLDINVTVDGKNLRLVETPERIEEIITNVTPAFQQAVREEIKRDADNPYGIIPTSAKKVFYEE